MDGFAAQLRPDLAILLAYIVQAQPLFIFLRKLKRGF